MHCVEELQHPLQVGGHWPPQPSGKKPVWQSIVQLGWHWHMPFAHMLPFAQLLPTEQLVGQVDELPSQR